MKKTLVCECRSERELGACFTELAKFGVTWSSERRIDPILDVPRYYPFSKNNIICIFLNKEHRLRHDVYTITWGSKTNEMKMGNTTFYGEECFLVDALTFIRLINFYFKKKGIYCNNKKWKLG